MLPELSAYFGVSIDELFALSDETRMERIQNMLWDVRFLNPADVENERQFLLEKARREPGNSDAHVMLAQLELHLAEEHKARAADYALEAGAGNPLPRRPRPWPTPWMDAMWTPETMRTMPSSTTIRPVLRPTRRRPTSIPGSLSSCWMIIGWQRPGSGLSAAKNTAPASRSW